MSSTVERRIVFHIYGYDARTPDSVHRSFMRGFDKFAALWSLNGSVGPLNKSDEQSMAGWSVACAGPNWSTQTEYRLLDWSDIIRDISKGRTLPRLSAGISTFADFMLCGAAFRYLHLQWHYAFFFFFPYVILAIFAILGGLAAWAVSGLTAGIVGAVLAGLAAIGVFALAYGTLGERIRVPDALDDWTYARALLHRTHEPSARRFALFAQSVSHAIADPEYDEVVIVGHSMGATIAHDVLDQALKLHDDSRPTPVSSRIALLTVGATIPKFLAHPSSGWIRTLIGRVMAHPRVNWIEIQGRRDFISFYRVHPFSLDRLRSKLVAGQPIVRQVNLKTMLSAETAKKLQFRIMRWHYQCVMANERKAAYDFHMVVSGPVGACDLALAPEGPLSMFGEDGALIAGAVPAFTR